MKEMQKINQNIKHKHHQLRIRFSLDEQMERVRAYILQSASKDEQVVLERIVGEGLGNSRQKLKVIKKSLEGSDDKEREVKKLISKYMLDLHLKEYIFGNTESKPTFINLLKQFDKIDKIKIETIIKAFLSIPLQQFTEARYSLELLDCFAKNQEMTEQETKLLMTPIQAFLTEQLEKCVKIVFGDGFKLKWIEYFVDVLRAVNNLVRVFSKSIEEGVKERILQLSRDIVTQHKVLTKEVLTQSYLLIIYLSPKEKSPDQGSGPCLIHYFHARNVVLGENILPDLLAILQTLKETEFKCQLVPIMLKAFQTSFNAFPDKTNIFDQVVSLFEVGRSVYSYLEEMISMIIKDPEATWNLQGNYMRKFFVATVALKNNVDTKVIFKQWPTIIPDSISQAGSMTIPYACDCVSILFRRLFQESGKDYKKWSSIWMQDYQKALFSEDRGQVRGIVEFVNPILLTIDPQPSLLKDIIALSHSQESSALQMGVIALLKCYKDIGKITVDSTKKTFAHTDDAQIQLTRQEVKDLLLHGDSTMSLKTLEFLTVHLKGSMPMQPLQLQLTLQFYDNCLKTSIPEYRKSYLTATKKMLQRLRQVYDLQVSKTAQQLSNNKRYKPKPYFKEFKSFLEKLIDLCFGNVFPDVIFQIANPSLEILLMVGQFFNRNRIEVKKGQTFEPAHLLNSTSYFKQRNFDNLLCCLQSSYESVRQLTHQILQFFYDLEDKQKLEYLWSESLINANKLTIKSYQYACRILAFISQVYPTTLSLPKKYSIHQLNICELFLNIVKERYQIFKIQFATQQENYYKNLIHGMLTVFSYTFDYIASKLRSSPQRFTPYYSELKQFLNDFFGLINQIVLFSVEVCSSNVSTVVLDSLPQSQTDKKYKVDCRGHFLEETSVSKSVGGLIQSSALLTSMENQEEGIENTLVVSFYLLTREAGLVFQSISNITATPDSSKYLPIQSLVELVNSYFYALINLKHMGSVDRIAGGLGKMARIIFENEDPRLSQLPQKLLDKLIVNLREGKFTNILRRSAGVPYAFTCLLKSQALKRKQMIQKTLTALLDLSLSNNAESIELRIHSLNILKKIFQDGDLKGDLDPYVSTAFISSIRGFTSQEWGVRNSSLMLFTILANRTVSIKPTYNLMEFFHRCPQLFEFFSQQLEHQQLDTMYPPLYPIVLLFSRLLPFDVSDRVKIPNKGELNLKQIRKDRLLQMLPLIQKAGLNTNHMGRVMAAKAILPFMQIDQIIPYSLNLLQSLQIIQQNNIVHYRLTAAYNLLFSLQELKTQQKFQPKFNQELQQLIIKSLGQVAKLVNRKQSSVIVELLFKIIIHFFEHFREFVRHHPQYMQIVQYLRGVTSEMIQKYFSNFDLIVPLNMGYSMAIKQCLQLHINLLSKYLQKPNQNLITKTYSDFLSLLSSRLSQDSKYLKIADTEIIQQYLKQILQFLKRYPNTHQLQSQIKVVIHQLDMRQVSSDNILIKIIELRTFLKIEMSPQNELFIKEVEKETKNHFLQIAIFKYFQIVNKEHPFILQLLTNYSKPEQLQELRECCVQYFSEYALQNPNHYVTYIRLLQDEEYYIRTQMAKTLSSILKLPQLNDEVLKKIILEKLDLSTFELWLQQATDYDIKRKNYEQERIFSYDKPNKYRSDISNFVYCLAKNKNLQKSKEALPGIILQNFKLHELQVEKQKKCISQYLSDIINRNQYMFETILRIFLLRLKDNQEALEIIFNSHPLFESVYQLYKMN